MEQITTREVLHKAGYIGLTIMVFAFLFAVLETWYFGYNWLPASKAEMYCDGIAAMVAGAGGGLLLYSIIMSAIIRIKTL